ncbi:MAG: hypothetical protein ACKO5F_15955 [Synechococcus sp.]
MSHERMLRAEKELEKEINALIRKAEILDAQEDRRYGKGNLGIELPDVLRHKQGRLEKSVRPARRWRRKPLPLLRGSGRRTQKKPGPKRRLPRRRTLRPLSGLS